MKTAISIPDPIYVAAERMSRRLRIPRSRLYTRAVEEYLKAHRNESVRELLNAIYSHEDSRLDPVFASLQALPIKPEEW